MLPSSQSLIQREKLVDVMPLPRGPPNGVWCPTQRSFQRRSPRLVDRSRLVQQYATRGLRGLYNSMSLALPKQTITASQGPQATNERYCGNTNTTVLSCLSHNRLWDSMQQLTSETFRSLLISPTSVSVPRPYEVYCPALVFRLAAHTVNRT